VQTCGIFAEPFAALCLAATLPRRGGDGGVACHLHACLFCSGTPFTAPVAKRYKRFPSRCSSFYGPSAFTMLACSYFTRRTLRPPAAFRGGRRGSLARRVPSSLRHAARCYATCKYNKHGCILERVAAFRAGGLLIKVAGVPYLPTCWRHERGPLAAFFAARRIISSPGLHRSGLLSISYILLTFISGRPAWTLRHGREEDGGREADGHPAGSGLAHGRGL